MARAAPSSTRCQAKRWADGTGKLGFTDMGWVNSDLDLSMSALMVAMFMLASSTMPSNTLMMRCPKSPHPVRAWPTVLSDSLAARLSTLFLLANSGKHSRKHFPQRTKHRALHLPRTPLGKVAAKARVAKVASNDRRGGVRIADPTRTI